MNGRPLVFSGECTRRLIVRLSAGAAMGVLLAGCVGDPTSSAKIDPASPIAADADRLVKSNRKWMKFSDIPPAPTDVRPAKSYGAAAADVTAARDQLEQATAPSSWSLTGTERFAAGASAEARDQAIESRDTDAFAKSARERATPPPPPR
jgi:hypothetical protein